MTIARKTMTAPTSGGHGHEIAEIAVMQSTYIAEPSAAEIRDILIANGMMAANVSSGS